MNAVQNLPSKTSNAGRKTLEVTEHGQGCKCRLEFAHRDQTIVSQVLRLAGITSLSQEGVCGFPSTNMVAL